MKRFIEEWFKQIEWATLSSILIVAGIKVGSSFGNSIVVLGIISIFFMCIYTFTFWERSIQDDFRKSIEEVNEKNREVNEKTILEIQPYAQFPSLAAAPVILFLTLILNIIIFFAIMFVVAEFALTVVQHT